ncbi:ras-related protein Rab-39B isoform X1 [Adelges cooleyi]|uniref:ras-related protein Rab-39B isoform X1 n=1 Tax=Adelges cooleyi TaxID=133065 RepID=UPI0021809397|nr:ras-related protein Rab-39B isoform X1 [Adelges cooleyi]
MADLMFDYQFRLILIGDSTVGKSSLLKFFNDGKFAEVSDPTVGVDFFARTIRIPNGPRIKLQLWDTAGQERFRSITKSYYRNSVGALLIYDITKRASFEHIPVWMNDAKRHIEPHRPVFVLVGCKLDLVNSGFSKREVTEEEAKQFGAEHNMLTVETSAKTGSNVELAFSAITQEIYQRIKSGEYQMEEGWDGIKSGYSHHSANIDFNNYVEAEPAKSCC